MSQVPSDPLVSPRTRAKSVLTTPPAWLNDERIHVVYRPTKILTAPNGRQITESFGHVWTFRIDMGGDGFVVFDATDMNRALAWEVIAKVEDKIAHLQSILKCLESGSPRKGGAA